jgi:hypothetical protein
MDIRSLLDHGVANGVITAAQRDSLLALGASDASVADPREAPRDFNGVMIAYGIGALVVIFAFAWFMVDRWRVLGDSGIFGLSIAYASVFLFVAHMLHRERFETARGVAMFLAIGMAPLAMRSLLRWTGLWTPELDLLCGMSEHPFAACQGDPMAIELTTVIAALFAIRAMAFAPFMIPIAIVCVTFPERMLREWNPGLNTDGAVMGWRYAIVASVLAAVAYTLDRRRKTEDYGAFLWIAVAMLTFTAGALLFQTDPSLRPWLAPTALLMITASLYLRRRVLLIVGLLGVLGFLAWLAFDVFKVTTGFPLVLAVLGVAIIILTVWVQKRFPEFIHRLGGDPNQPPHFPGGVASLLVPALLGLLLTESAASIDKESAADRRSRSHANASRYRARRDSIAEERARKGRPQPRELR